MYKQHASDLMKKLRDQIEEGLHCDAILQTSDGQKFPVHRNVLTASSLYFKAMFSGGFMETKSSEKPIVLESITSSSLRFVLDCLYLGALKLTDETVYDVFTAAHMLQLPDILQSCEDHLTKKMSVSTCFQSLRLSEMFELRKVRIASEKFILQNFAALSEHQDFLAMSRENLCKYLKSDQLKGKGIDIYKATNNG